MSLHPAYPVGGCDISANQGVIDFDKLIDAGMWFIIARASISTYADTRYPGYRLSINSHRLPMGAYHAWSHLSTPANNAAALIKAQPDKLPMRIWLDCEVLTNLTRVQSTQHILNTLDAIDGHYQVYTGLYFNQESWARLIEPSYYDQFKLDLRPLWVANYIDTLADSTPNLPAKWPRWDVWQFSAEHGPYGGKGASFGVSSASLDIDAFYGSQEQFEQFIGGEIVEPPPEETPMKVKTITVANIRNNPDFTDGSDVGNLDPNEVLEVDADSGQFWKLKNLYVAKSVVMEIIMPPPPSVPEYRVAHDTEYQPQWRGNGVGVPEVFHFDQDAPTPLTKEWQEFIVALNPGISGGGYRSLCKWDRAFTNGTGYDNPNGNLYADFINKRDLTAKLPVVDKVRCCGGAILHGTLNGSILTVETLDGTKPPPSLDWILLHPWFRFRCYTIAPDGLNHDFPQNGGKPVYFPLVATAKVTVEINKIVPSKPYPYVKRI